MIILSQFYYKVGKNKFVKLFFFFVFLGRQKQNGYTIFLLWKWRKKKMCEKNNKCWCWGLEKKISGSFSDYSSHARPELHHRFYILFPVDGYRLILTRSKTKNKSDEQLQIEQTTAETPPGYLCRRTAGIYDDIWAAAQQNQQNDGRPAKTQISLDIRPIWSESSLCAQWVTKVPSFRHADKEDSDQTGRMPMLIWVLAGRTVCWFCYAAAHFQKLFSVNVADGNLWSHFIIV